jgi:peptidoglycan/xylan/chitin deacetylase (PgdA/CDA1 family)
MRLCAVSVDLDEIPNYFKIHGLPAPKRPASTAVYDVALGRLGEMAADASIPLTLFAVGADLDRAVASAGLALARAKGHEIANHSLGHRYDLTRMSADAIRSEVVGGIEAIEAAVGERPVGFRAPGYTITDTVFDVLTELGVQYDSSVFPCPSYYGAKATVIGGLSVLGRPSQSIVDRPTVLLAPTEPYRVGRPYWRPGSGMLELPIQVTRGMRLPFIGTYITLAGVRGATWLARMCVGAPLINLELHGIDVLDASDGLEALRPHQQDVRVSRERKLEALHAVFQLLAREGYAFVTLREAAEQARGRVARVD